MLDVAASWRDHLGLIFRRIIKRSKRGGVVITMIFFSLVALSFLHLYYGFDAIHGYAYMNATEGLLDQTASIATSRDEVQDQSDQILRFINSKANKELFVAFENAEYAFYDPDVDVVGTGRFSRNNHYQLQPYVSNGYLGSRIPSVGQGFTFDQVSSEESVLNTLNGWPLGNKRYAGAFIAGFFDLQPNATGTNFPELLENGYESVIASVPQWTTLQISTTINDTDYTLDPAFNDSRQGEISDYVQALSLRNGIVTTEFTWLNTFRVKYDILAHRDELSLGLVNLQISNLNQSSTTVKVTDILDINTAIRSQVFDTGKDDGGIYINFHPDNIDYVYGSIYSKLVSDSVASSHKTSDKTSAVHEMQLDIHGGSSVAFTKYLGVVSSDLNPESLKTKEDVAKMAKTTACKYDLEDKFEIFESHIESWNEILLSKITIKDDLLLTLANRASLYHLAANTRASAQGVTAALAVSGLSSDSYGGMVFWDTDLWMLNGLIPYLPEHTKSIVNYRLHTHQQAIQNKPEGYDGAVYPWTSGRFGNCTATGPCMDYEYHINMAVSFAAWQVYLSGNGDEDYLRDITSTLIDDAAKFMADYVTYNSTLKEYTTHNLTDPDEFANHVDNGAYTNAGISLLMKYAIDISKHLEKSVPTEFTNIADNVHLPFSDTSDNITLEYSSMNSSIEVKQADVIMVTYPLENEMITEEQALVNMQFYAMKQVSDGPAMTFPIFSIVSSALSESGCSSQSYLKKSVKPFLRAPFAQFLEQNNDDPITGGTHPAFPFLTGHGGFLQATLQGLTGMRYDYEMNKNGRIERMLKLDPIELPLLGNIEFEGIRYMNNSLTLTVNETHLTVFNEGPLPGSNIEEVTIKVAERNPDSGKYKLKAQDKLVIPLLKMKQSYDGSISECSQATFLNITESNFGDIDTAINDGDNFTHWQPMYKDGTAKVLIDLSKFKNITGGTINWGDKPPKTWSLSKLNMENDLSAYEVLSLVDFGNDSMEKYRFFRPKDQKPISQNQAFTKVIDEEVEITAPFDMAEFVQYKVQIPDVFNTTTFNHSFTSRFLLLEFSGTHDSGASGAKLFEFLLY